MGPRRRVYRRNEDVGASTVPRCLIDDLESKRERARSALRTYQTQLLDDRPMIAPATDGHRNRNMASWNTYLTNVMQVDPDKVWLDLCRGTKEAMDYCRVFLRSYVEDSEQKFAILGPEEYEHRRTVNSASSVTQCWREIIAQADSTVLREKRREDPDNAALWRLRFLDHTHQRGQGPVFELSRWIFQDLARELGLAVTLTFEKIEATAEDVIVILNTLWERASDIPCQPTTRLSFHGSVLLAALGGFRQATIRTLKYRHVELALVRDPHDRLKTKLIVTPTIGKNKLKRATRVSRATAIAFSVTLVPYSTICLASVIAARAIKDNAFDPSFESVDELLSRPQLEDVDFLPLKWKDDKLDDEIFKLSSATFYDLWHRTCLVSGLREDPRFYTMRVGAGARLDGTLTDALRNYILSNTTQVFQGSYQTHRVREDLTKLAFGPRTGCNDSLFQSLRSMSLRRDAGAPIDASAEDVLGFEGRSDVRILRAALETARRKDDKREFKSVKSQLENLINTLSRLKVQERRTEYFNRVDSLRAQGIPTVDSREVNPDLALPRKRGNAAAAAAAVGRFLRTCTEDVDQCRPVEQSSKLYMELLVDYQAHRPQRSVCPEHLDHQTHGIETPQDGPDQALSPVTADGPASHIPQEKSRCLLGCGSFRGRSELTKHCKDVHVKRGTFDQPFSCPECLRRGRGDVLIEGGAPAWSNHAETVHGKINAPNLPTFANPTKGSRRCRLCSGFFVEGGGLARHVRRIHDQRESAFKKPFPCPECRREGKGDLWIDGIAAWYGHDASFHGEPERRHTPCVSDENEAAIGTRKRKRDSEATEAVREASMEIAAIAIGSDWSEDYTNIDSTPDGVIDSTPETQTPASSVGSDITQRIDPRLLSDHSRQDQETIKSNRPDPLGVSDNDPCLSSVELGPVVDRSEGIEGKNLETDCISSVDPQPMDCTLFHTRMISSRNVEIIEPISLSRCFDRRRNITPEQVQEAVEIRSPLSEEGTVLGLSRVSLGDESLPSRENLSSNPHHHDAPQICLPSRAEASQQSVQPEKESLPRRSPVLTPDLEEMQSNIAKFYWGRGFALAPEGSELNRSMNNAQRREEISSNISSEHVIKGKRLRIRKSG